MILWFFFWGKRSFWRAESCY